MIRNQQSNNDSSIKKEVLFDAITAPAITAAPVPKTVAAPSVWGSFLEEEDIDMLSLLAARDASLTQKKENAVTPIVKKEKIVASADHSDSLNPPFLSRALACWKVDAVCDPCPYGSEILIDAALNGADEDEEERSAHSYEAMQHVQQMLAGYIAASEAEEDGEGDLGRDDPALLELLKSEMIAGKGTHNREKEKEKEKGKEKGKGQGQGQERGKSGGTSLTKNSSSSQSGRLGADKSEENDGDISMPNRSDCRSRVESAFQAAVSHAPSQVVRFAYGGSPLWCTYPPPVASSIVPKCVCGAERVFEMQLMPGKHSSD